MPHRICGGHCQPGNVNPATTMKCRNCKNSFHMPCHDIILPLAKVFTNMNIVFICDTCLDVLDGTNSPDRKRKTNRVLRDSLLSPNVNSTKMPQQQQHVQQSGSSVSKQTSNEQLYELLMSLSEKVDKQSSKVNEISDNVDTIGNGVMKTYKKTEDAYNVVYSRLMLREQQSMRDLAKETFGVNQKKNITSMLQTPKGNTDGFGGSRRTYSTVLQNKLTVTPLPESTSERKRETHITLVNNKTGQVEKSTKLPTPKQGKKDVQIGRPVVERQRVPRNVNPLSNAIRVSNFDPNVNTEEVEKYIVENTEVTDKTKFKCIKLVKKDADLSQYTYVSFKISATPDAFDILKKPEIWPKNNFVREFDNNLPPKRTLSDFMTTNKATPKQQTATNAMDFESDVIENGNVNVSSHTANGSSNNNGNSSSTSLPKN